MFCFTAFQCQQTHHRAFCVSVRDARDLFSNFGVRRSSPPAATQPNHSSKMNPVIADVVSLANGSAAQPSASADTALTG